MPEPTLEPIGGEDPMLLRRLSRAVMGDRASLALHRSRLRVATRLPGSEPTQGVLADLYRGCTSATSLDRRAALEVAAPCLPAATWQAFDAYDDGRIFPACSRLATRWSVLVHASLDVPPRQPRSTGQASRELAQAAVAAWQAGDEVAQVAFLDHCWVTGDALAFMHARRALLREQAALPPRWATVSAALQSMLGAA